MPDVPLLQPAVLNGIIQKFTAPESLLGRQKLFGADRVNNSPDPYVVYDIIEGSREKAVPNVPNAEAHIVKQLGVGQVTASMIYMRDKKVFSPTTLRWLRKPGTTNVKDAEAVVLRELQDMDNRFERFAEWCIWQAMTTGKLEFTGGGVVIKIDYQFASDHKPTVTVDWDEANADIIGDVQTFKRLVSRDGQAVLRNAYLNAVAMTYFTKNQAIKDLLKGSQEKTNELLNTGQLTNVLGLTWKEYDMAYVDDNGTVTQYIPDGTAVFTSDENPDRWYFYQGPSADNAAPEGYIGKFAKSWEEQDPSARQHLEEWSFLPGIWRLV